MKFSSSVIVLDVIRVPKENLLSELMLISESNRNMFVMPEEIRL